MVPFAILDNRQQAFALPINVPDLEQALRHRIRKGGGIQHLEFILRDVFHSIGAHSVEKDGGLEFTRIDEDLRAGPVHGVHDLVDDKRENNTGSQRSEDDPSTSGDNGEIVLKFPVLENQNGNHAREFRDP